ncbi:O-antigen ligase [Pseudonocardia thermophila]|uniref:O-antigen ligase n=1 Tax=Pseudonocardia thermophila TaxID=1848 RepID=A0A1M6TFN3_PSETH|nr:O-antigen ligase family protein [Pseudonocardia thermophila]SHK55578.1 O-antigen ligase [Pseudonocardia thermophila]
MTAVAPPAPAAPPPPPPPRPRLPLGLTPLHVGTIAVGIGVLAVFISLAINPIAGLLAVGVVVGLTVAAWAVWNPTVALCLLVAGEFCNLSGVFENRVPGVYMATLGLSLLATVAAVAREKYRSRIRRNWWQPLVLVIVYLISIVPSAIGSADPALTATALDDWVKNLVMLTVVLLLLQMSDRPWAFAIAAILPMSTICVMMALNEWVVGNGFTFGGFSTIASEAGADIAAARHSGPTADANYWGRFLLIGLPLAMALAHRAWKAKRRWPLLWWIGHSFLLFLGIYLTQSRGTLVAAGAAVVVWIIAVGPQMRRMALFLLPLSVLALALPGIGDRLLTLTEAFSGPSYAADQSLVERSNVADVAFTVFEKNPIFGTGPATFKTEIAEYAPLANTGSTGDITATHNLYLEILADTGIVGMAGWIVFVGGSILLAMRAVIRLAGARPDGGRDGRPTRALAAGSLAGLVGWSVASTFLHIAYPRILLLACAFAGTLYSIAFADRRLDRPFALAATRRAQRGFRFGLVATIATTIAAALVAGTLLTALSRTTYVAVTDMTLLPTSDPDNYPGYALGIRGRQDVLPTYAAVIQHGAPQPETTVSADPPRGVMSVRAVADTPEEAVARRDAVVRSAQTIVERQGLGAAFRTVIVDEKAPESTLEITTTIVRIVLIATIVEILVVISLSARLRREERRQGGFV